ncbi:MAG TPA: YhcH/YjgK/YiaL family protein [Anaeromyxobacter sp.]|nr:YhcH/YjgK/YiaL family protein [Anaeromyxobacter sp.]
MLAGSIATFLQAPARPQAVQEILRRAADPALLGAPLGRQAIDGDRLCLVLSEYVTQAAERSWPESHREHCDVQVVLFGEERIGWTPLGSGCLPRGAFDADKDLQLYQAVGALSWLAAAPGTFFLFEPSDVHQPGIAATGGVRVRKLVGKIHRSLLGL